jgi:hypothetical protein
VLLTEAYLPCRRHVPVGRLSVDCDKLVEYEGVVPVRGSVAVRAVCAFGAGYRISSAMVVVLMTLMCVFEGSVLDAGDALVRAVAKLLCVAVQVFHGRRASERLWTSSSARALWSVSLRARC